MNSTKNNLESIEVRDTVNLTLERSTKRYYPNYMVVHNMTKDELYTLADAVRGSDVFVIPVYTKSVDDFPDFSDYNYLTNSEYIVKPLYVGDNLELERLCIKNTVEMLYKEAEIFSSRG